MGGYGVCVEHLWSAYHAREDGVRLYMKPESMRHEHGYAVNLPLFYYVVICRSVILHCMYCRFEGDGKGHAFFWDHSQMRDGWVYSPNRKSLLFWVPPPNRLSLFWPRNTAVIGATPTRIDFGKFVHGRDWVDCWKPLR